ncbi:uncharacterized protein LOC131671320 [Phymastichus coffea]|uniref:uncharacterized protein LOC131671320 n=1 Tax=Phymastichus coffea TaxID=108790 RepID=UPI00273B18E7|nr:uncharacterized protein LOC131671320 [Phymastichus coffea]XP_058803653.1 uncharacterized protein LOC131671320 [Phymastichus coffea]
MPSPTLLAWCTTPISSLQQSVQELLNRYMKRGFQVPSQVLEIQGLSGKTPGDKWKSLNAIVNGIVESVKNGDELEGQLSALTPSLLNLVKTNVGVKLQLSHYIVESLKSEDVSVNKRALSARWYFHGGNPRVTVDHFVNDILPFVSVRTRLNIVKRLARGLRGYEAKAQQFFTQLVELYGVQTTLPILIACSDDVILDTILRYKIVLPLKILKMLFSRGSHDVAVRYLRLSNGNGAEGDDNGTHQISIHYYDAFLPKLITHHPRDFVALYSLTPEKMLPTLSRRKTACLLEKVKDAIIDRSDIFLKLLQPKVVKAKLSQEDIERMLENYLPNDIADFVLGAALDFVDNYCDDIQILMRKFVKKYGKNLVDHARNIAEPGNIISEQPSLKFLCKLSMAERKIQINLLLDNLSSENDFWRTWLMSYLPTDESLPYFKEKMAKCFNADDRDLLIGCMVHSCRVQNSKSDLLNVLKYFRDRHKNAKHDFVMSFFIYLTTHFTLSELDEAHWSVVREILNNARVINQLLHKNLSLWNDVLEGMLCHIMTGKKRNDQHLEEVIDTMVFCKMGHPLDSWNVLGVDLALEKECMERFFLLVPIKYPENHSMWSNIYYKLTVTLSLFKSIKSYNDRSTKAKMARIEPKDYPWMTNLAGELLSHSTLDSAQIRLELLARLFKEQAPDLYEQKMSECSAIRNIDKGDAIELLKRHPDKVLADWLDYLNQARKIIRSKKRVGIDKVREKLRARRFIAATRWHDQLPMNFIEACLSDIKVEGSLAVLGILLPGDAFATIVKVYAPKQAEVKTKQSFDMAIEALEGMKLTNPPVPLASLQAFCRGDYLRIADGALSSLAPRVSVAGALDLVGKLAGQQQPPLLKRALLLARTVATKQRFRELLVETLAGSSELSIRRHLAKMIFGHLATSSPHEANCQLMLDCLRRLTPDDVVVMSELNEVETIPVQFLPDYAAAYLAKVEEIFAATWDFQWRSKCVCLLVESFDERLTRHLPERLCKLILNKYFFDSDCTNISNAVRTFAVRYYLLACADHEFGSRLTLLVNILKKTAEGFDVSHPKKRRCYPANYTIQQFFNGLLSELCASDVAADKKLRIVESVSEIFKMNLSPWQEPKSYVCLNLYKEYLHSTSPENFGNRTGKQISTLIEELESNIPVAMIAECLDKFVSFNQIFRNDKNPHDLKMSLIKGLLQGDEYYGALTSISLLDLKPSDIAKYDERYDQLISTLRQMKNSSIQYNLYQHLNHLLD